MSPSLAARSRPSVTGRARGLRPLLVSATAAAVLVPASAASADAVDYGLTGTTHLKALTTEPTAVSGSLSGQLSNASGVFVGDLALQPTQGKLVGTGFLTITGKFGFFPAGKATGSLSDGVLTVKSKVRIKLVDTSLKTFTALEIGNSCQTKKHSDIELKSAPGFDPAIGGTLTATFANSDFNGCAGLAGLASPFVASGDNSISVTVAPKG